MRTVALLSGLALALAGGCSSPPRIDPEQAFWFANDTVSIAEMEFSEPPLIWREADHTFFEQVKELVDLDRNFRKLFGTPKEAHNINSFDEVPSSSWFTNRGELSAEEIYRGNAHTPPDTSGIWTVSRPKVGGATPGFWITDAKGDRYIIKFDPAGHPEMATAAAIMGARYFWAAGYNVPEEYIVEWDPSRLVVGDDVTFKDSHGVKHPFTKATLDSLLADVNSLPNGRIRSSASRLIPNVKGPFSFKGTRSEDPNDWCPHQHRRELRGLYVVASLVNHYDTKDHNTMDAFVTSSDGPGGYLRHYLIDFASAFGSDGDKPKHPRKGYANWVDLRDILVSTVTLGLKTWGWENHQPESARFPSIGYFESDIFEPNKFDPITPNPAFEQRTDRDGFWGAKIVARFDDERLRAVVRAGELSNPDAEAYLLQTLLERREKILRYWFARQSPLDDFTPTIADGDLHVEFSDLGADHGIDAPTGYQIETVYQDQRVHSGESQSPHVTFNWSTLKSMLPDTTDSMFEIRIGRYTAERSWEPISVWLRYQPMAGIVTLIGVKR